MPVNPDKPYGGKARHSIVLYADSGSSNLTIQPALNITPQVVEFNIREDIFSSAMSIDISVLDSTGQILDKLPFTGQEAVEVNIVDGTFKYTQLFRVYKLSTPRNLQEKSYAYTIYGTSSVVEKSITTSMHSSYKGETGDQIVKKVYDEHFGKFTGKKLVVEPGTNLLTYTAAGHNPIEFINMVGSDTQSSQFPESSKYIFYEDGTNFNFVTLNSLLSKNAQADFYYADPGTERGSDGKNYILGINWHNNADTLRSLRNGLYDNTVGAIDLITKTYKEYVFNYSKEFNSLSHLPGGKPTVLAKSGLSFIGDQMKGSSHVRLIPTDFNVEIENQTIDGRINETNDPHKFHASTKHNFYGRSIANVVALQQYKLDITSTMVPSIRAGNNIRIYIPSNDGDASGFSSRYFSIFGERNPIFIVTSHIITYNGNDGNYFSTFECAKESLGRSLGGSPALPLDLFGKPEPQNKEQTPNPSGENTTQNQEQTLEEATSSVEGQLLSATDESGLQGLPYSTLTPLEKQVAISSGYVDTDTYPDELFE